MNKIAVVTGGNRGIGYEICRQLADFEDIQVVLTARTRQKAEQAAQTLGQTTGRQIGAFPLEVTSSQDIQALASYLEKTYGRCDILVNNAGIFPDAVHQMLKVDINLMRTTMEVNAYAPLALIQALLPLMRRHNWGRIVNISSGIGELGGLGSSYPTYRLSKITLNLITRIVAQELKGGGIKINAASPGWVRTDMGGAGAPVSVEDGADTAVWLATLPDDGPSGGFFHKRELIPW